MFLLVKRVHEQRQILRGSLVIQRVGEFTNVVVEQVCIDLVLMSNEQGDRPANEHAMDNVPVRIDFRSGTPQRPRSFRC